MSEYVGHFGDESLEAIDRTGTVNQKGNNLNRKKG